MTIYIEVFLIQNILINFCLLRLVYLTTKTKSSFFKLCLASIVGASSSVISTYFFTIATLINLIKVATAFSMILIAFKSNRKQFVFNFILLFLFTYSLGGMISAFSSASYMTSFGIITTSKLNLNSITIFIIIISYLYELVVKHLKHKIQINEYVYNIKLFKDKNSININAYLDTGNLLNINGNPVVIIDLNSFLKLCDLNLIDFYLNKSETVNLKTVTGQQNLKIFQIDRMEIKEKQRNIIHENLLVAVNTTNAFKDTNYKALLSPLLM